MPEDWKQSRFYDENNSDYDWASDDDFEISENSNRGNRPQRRWITPEEAYEEWLWDIDQREWDEWN